MENPITVSSLLVDINEVYKITHSPLVNVPDGSFRAEATQPGRLPKVFHRVREIDRTVLIKWFVYSGIIYFTCWLLPGIKVADFRIAFIVCAVLAIINAVAKPILILFTLPITILTLGLSC
jgi:Mycobacterial 4 TMS phage holin, superfamily IV